MISKLVIRRLRFALVISIVISLAGLTSITQIPVAQFPDIAPLQVQISAVFPGAGADVVKSTVAQPIKQQVVGVSDMLYMKKTSGADGSYNQTVTFAPGTDPDINTVNVQNRVNLAEAVLPEEVTRSGVSTKKKSSALLQVITITSDNPEHDTLFLSNFATINVLDNVKRMLGVGDALIFGAQDYAMERRARGMGIVEAAIDGARACFRAVMMTSFAFIAGLYVIAQWSREKIHRLVGASEPESEEGA